MQEIVREIKLLRENMKMCENTIQLCNTRLSTISALCQLFVHQDPTPVHSISQEVPILLEGQGQGAAQAEVAIQAQPASLVIFEPFEIASTQPTIIENPLLVLLTLHRSYRHLSKPSSLGQHLW